METNCREELDKIFPYLGEGVAYQIIEKFFIALEKKEELTEINKIKDLDKKLQNLTDEDKKKINEYLTENEKDFLESVGFGKSVELKAEPEANKKIYVAGCSNDEAIKRIKWWCSNTSKSEKCEFVIIDPDNKNNIELITKEVSREGYQIVIESGKFDNCSKDKDQEITVLSSVPFLHANNQKFIKETKKTINICGRGFDIKTSTTFMNSISAVIGSIYFYCSRELGQKKDAEKLDKMSSVAKEMDTQISGNSKNSPSLM